jgi:hypothetical protein
MGSFTIRGQQTTQGGQTKAIGPATILGAHNPQAVTTEVTLLSGTTSVTVPPTATAVVILPPTGNTQTLAVRTFTTSGVGVRIGKTGFSAFCFPAGSSPLLVTAGGNTPGPTQFTFA